MGRSRRGIVLGVATTLLLALVGIGMLTPGVRAAGQTFSSCPDAATFQDYLTAGGTIQYSGITPCTIPLTGPLTIAPGQTVEIDGGAGLILSGGTSTAPGGFVIISITPSPNPTSLTLDQVALEYGTSGVIGEGNQTTVTLRNSTVRSMSNSSGSSIGINVLKMATLTNSTITGISSGGTSIGITADTATLTNSTISGITSSNGGATLGILATTTTLTNSTMSGITSSGATGISAGIQATSSATLTNSTITGVSGSNSVGVLSVTATLTASILADNGRNCQIIPTDGGHNLSTDASCDFGAGSTSKNNVPLTGSDGLNLLSLSNYGGPTPTIALGPGSVAIDFVPESFCTTLQDADSALRTDQRGVTRPQGTACDAGAYVAPALNLAVDPASPDGSNGWYVSDPTITFGYSGLAIGQDDSGAAVAQVASCSGLNGLSHTATGLNDSGSVQTTVTTNGTYSVTCGVTQGTTALGFSYSGPSENAMPFDLNVDTTKPTINLITPANNASYSLNQAVAASYTCTDATSQIAASNGCVGTVADGSPLDTDTPGNHTFTVNATDQAGNTATKSVTYTIGYQITTLPGSSQTVTRGYYALIRFYPADGDGHDLASRMLKATSLELDGPNGQQIAFVHQFQFGRFGGKSSYQLSINTRNLSVGTWKLVVQIGSGQAASTGTIPFRVQ